MLKGTSYEGAKTDETTIIGRGVKIEGKLSSSGDIRVEGNVEGDITSQGAVVIGSNGRVNGQVNAESITIGGNVNGTVRAKEKLVLDSNGNLKGDIFTKTLLVDAGANFNGNCKMGGDLSNTYKPKEESSTETNVKK
jgi:cytoskeletal protein CcmA (bactofilin family)